MSTIVTRAGKGASLSWAEADANFNNLNTDKVEIASLAASDGSSEVGFLQDGTGAVAGTVQSKLRESVSVKDFGVVGDGSTSDTAAMIVALAEGASKKLLVPAGTYKLPFSGSSALTPPANCVIEGEGSGITILRFEPDSTSTRSFFTCSAGNLTLRNLTVSCVVPSTGIVLFFNFAASGLTLDHCEFDGTMTNSGATLSHTAHLIAAGSSGTANDVDMQDCDIHRISYGFLKTSASTAINRRISAAHCDFYGNYNEDWSFNSPASGSVCDDVQTYMCRFRDGAGAGASISQLYSGFASVSNFSVGGCSFEGTATEAIHLEENCTNWAITGNVINIVGGGIFLTDNNLSGTDSMPQYGTISGNTMKFAGTPKAAGFYGLNLVYNVSTEVPVKNVTIVGNYITDYEIGFLSGATLDDGCSVTGNIVNNCTRGFQVEFASLSVSGNTSRNCDVGIYNGTWGIFDQHTFINCTVNVDAATRPVTLVDPIFIFPEFSVGAGSTTYNNLVDLGANDRVYGDLVLTVMSNTAADQASRTDLVLWDGTTFTRTNKLVYATGAIAVDTVTNSSILAIQTFSTNALSTVVVQAKLNGSVIVAV